MAASVRALVVACAVLVAAAAGEVREVAPGSAGARYTLHGVVVKPSLAPDSFCDNTQIRLDGGQHVANMRDDCSFIATDLPGASYLLEVTSLGYLFEPLRVDISRKFEQQARVFHADFLGGGALTRVPYSPEEGLIIRAKSEAQYFEVRQPWSLLDMVKNPMVLMTLVPLGMMLLMNVMMKNMDPEELEEMKKNSLFSGSNQQAANLDFSESLAKLTSGGAPAGGSGSKKKLKARG